MSRKRKKQQAQTVPYINLVRLSPKSTRKNKKKRETPEGAKRRKELER